MNANPILLQQKYARIIELLARRTGLSGKQALDQFYRSKTFELISGGVAGMHCFSDEYLAEEVAREIRHRLHPAKKGKRATGQTRLRQIRIEGVAVPKRARARVIAGMAACPAPR